MTYTICAEWFLIYQIVMNLIMLSLIEQLFFSSATLKRKLFVSSLDAILSLGMLMLPGMEVFTKLTMIAFVSGMILVGMGFPWVTYQKKLEMCGAMIFFSFCFGSVLNVMIERKIMRVGVISAVLATYLLYRVTLKICRLLMVRKKQRFYQISLFQDGIEVSLRALMDSGNLLRAVNETISSVPLPVVIVEQGKLPKKLFLKNAFPIAYQTMGNPQGMLYGYVVEKLTVNGNGMTKHYANVYVGVYENSLSKKGYAAILPDFQDLDACYNACQRSGLKRWIQGISKNKLEG